MVVGISMAQFSFMQLGLKCTTDNTILGVHNPVMGRGVVVLSVVTKPQLFPQVQFAASPIKVALYKLIFKSSAKILEIVLQYGLCTF